jgi:O-acetyl-ADP-ribose deacetylase (regulator of RNase III)
MELKRSGACQALVRVGGKTLQDECKSKYGNKLEEGNVAEIGGGNLSCKSVFLTVLPRFNADAINVSTLKKNYHTQPSMYITTHI